MSESPQVISEKSVTSFKSTHDVIVVGMGIAGVCAALEARRAGSDVMAVERASAGGGASAMSSGLFYLGGGTDVQKACGFDDDAENMYRFMTSCMGTEQADLIRRYCDNSVEHFNWLEAQGVPFERSYHADKAVFLLTTEGLLSTGNEKVWPYRDLARPVPRGHQVTEEGESPCRLAMEHLINKCIEEGVQATYDSRATALVVDDNGRVVGVQYRQNGQVETIKATKGVILTTGGFTLNDEMTKEHFLVTETMDPLGSPYSDGSGIKLGQSAGAKLESMDGHISTASIYPPGQLIKGIIVNSEGKRFVAEDSYHGRTAAFISEQPHLKAYLIVDSEIFAYPEIETARHQLIDGYETIEEMETALEMPKGSLCSTLESYNKHAADGKDPDFYKYSEWVKPLDQGPWAVFDISYDRSSYYYLTLGGMKTNADSQVLRANGSAIPGLYAAGACAVHIADKGKSYASGMSLGQGSFFGRVAGQHCAQQ